ncbi:sensor histidine kinase [Immundisolibacter sp.]|uniref:sensor histidine kinase n=1 Tax=Immundisolibacter sp. TaxID=1934948 RepID=UPI003F83B3E8
MTERTCAPAAAPSTATASGALASLAAPNTHERLTWRPLLWFNLLRLGSSGLLLGLSLLDPPLKPLGSADPVLYRYVAIAYLLGAALAPLALVARWPRFNLQTTALVGADIAALTLLMHASGGLGSGLGTLLVVVVAGGGLLVSGRLAFLYAALAALAVLVQSLYRVHIDQLAPTYTQAGVLGSTCFAAAALAYEMARRARRSALLASARQNEALGLARLNDEIIQRMQTGVLVIDPAQRVRLANGSAARLLGRHIARDTPLAELAPPIADALARWRSGRESPPEHSTGAYVPRFAPLGTGHTADALIFLDDTAAVNQQAQLLKLASLGRLAASIAHQVRNPLSGISHAAQLLQEDDALTADQARLVAIMLRQGERVNRIVEEVLALGRSQPVQPELLDLSPWLTQVVDTYCTSRRVPADAVALHLTPGLVTRGTPGQLQQAIENLLDNALWHAAGAQAPQVTIRTRVSGTRERPLIEIEDRGPGVPPAERERLFEPFNTNRADGTGLGLFMARELCTANQAHIDYYTPPAGGAGFRIVLADRRRRQLT